MKATTASLLCTLALLAASTLMFTVRAQAASPITVLHALSGSPEYPAGGLVADSSGNLYGTTSASNGGCGCGTVFELTPQAGGGWQFSVIHEFTYSDGSQPFASLIIDASGNLYGTTNAGGAHNLGTVFALHPAVSGWKERVLYSFGASSGDLQSPYGSLTMDAAGNLYGTTASGGTSRLCGAGCGGVFKLTRSGAQWNESVLYNFIDGLDGGQPLANLIWDSAGNLYGTTALGGANGEGVVFELSPSTSGSWTETTLYAFAGSSDGSQPHSGLLFDSTGSLYGTTSVGGNTLCDGPGCGTVFKLAPQGAGSWAFSVLFTFDGSNGGSPQAGLVSDAAGNLYGTGTGGKNNYGVVFGLSPSGSNWTESFASFNLKNGSGPQGQLILNNGVLYGTTENGGAGQLPGNGVVFALPL
jgi:uncharacterized repeat protein (TIGR03803 family)